MSEGYSGKFVSAQRPEDIAPSPDEFKDLREALPQATPGPWRKQKVTVDAETGREELWIIGPRNEALFAAINFDNRGTFEANADLVAAANPAVLAKLIARLDKAEAKALAFKARDIGWSMEVEELKEERDTLTARIEVLEGLAIKTADYLDDLQNNMLRNDADMKLDSCKAPGIVAEEILRALTAKEHV